MKAADLEWSLGRWLIFLLHLVFLLPHGIGFSHPFGLPNIDLPRAALLGLHVLALFSLYRYWPGNLFSGPIGIFRAVLLFEGFWQFLAALYSAAPSGSLVWATGNWLSIWGLAFLVVSHRSFRTMRDQWANAFFITGITLVLWALSEFLLQERIIIARNTWAADMLDYSIRLRRHFLLAIGPYPNNHYLGIAICAFSGFLLRSSWQRVPIGVGLCCAVLSTGFVAGWLAFGLILVLNLVISSNRNRVHAWLPFFVFLGGIVLIWHIGIPNGDIGSTDWAFLADESADNRGSFAARWQGIVSAGTQVVSHPLIGYGPGAIGDVKRVPTALYLNTDLGSMFAFFVESGVLVGVPIVVLVLAAVIIGFRSGSEHAISAALGITGIAVTGLSSPVSYFWGLGFVMCGYIFLTDAPMKRQAKQSATEIADGDSLKVPVTHGSRFGCINPVPLRHRHSAQAEQR